MGNNFIGENIRKIRRENGLSQEAFASIVDVSRQTVSTWETGKSFPDSYSLAKICKEFDVKADEFFTDNIIVEDNGKSETALECVEADCVEVAEPKEKISFFKTLAGKLTIAASVLFLAAVVFVISIGAFPASKSRGLAFVTSSQWNLPFDLNIVIFLTLVFILVIMIIIMSLMIAIWKKHKYTDKER